MVRAIREPGRWECESAVILQVELFEDLLGDAYKRACGEEDYNLFKVIDWGRENGLVLEGELEQWRRGLTMRIAILADDDHTQTLELLSGHAELLGLINGRVDDRLKGFEMLTQPKTPADPPPVLGSSTEG